jgi:hypothetical protein
MEECPYATLNIRGLTQWITCSKNNNELCAFQRYCSEVRKVINSEGSAKCPLKLEKEK